MTTANPKPTCEECGQETSRTTTTAGKGRYQCINPMCPNFLKRYYIRGSSK